MTIPFLELFRFPIYCIVVDAVSTSPLKGEAISGSVVTTQSGSRYVMHVLFVSYPGLHFVPNSLIMRFSYSLVSSAADTF